MLFSMESQNHNQTNDQINTEDFYPRYQQPSFDYDPDIMGTSIYPESDSDR